MALFTVRRLTTGDEVLVRVAVQWSSEGFKQGALDHASFFAADDKAFFVGELDNEPIGFISIIKHAQNYAVVGQFLVYQPYRGRGYGLKKAMEMAALGEGCNIGLVSTKELEHVYKRSCFKRAWLMKHFDFVAQEASLALKDTIFPDLRVFSVIYVDFHDVVDYDASVFGFSRHKFLQKWLYAPNSHAYVAAREEGKVVVGYIVVRSTLRPERGWKIGPLFANDSNIARSLYRAVFDRICAEDEKAIVCVYAPSMNGDAPALASGILCETYVKMYTKGIPSSMVLHKIYGQTALGCF